MKSVMRTNEKWERKQSWKTKETKTEHWQVHEKENRTELKQ